MEKVLAVLTNFVTSACLVGIFVCLIILTVLKVRKTKSALEACKKIVIDIEDILFVFDKNLNIIGESKAARERFLSVMEGNLSLEEDSKFFEALKNLEVDWEIEWQDRYYLRHTVRLFSEEMVYGYLVFFIDNTEKHYLLEELTSKKQKAEEANNAKTSFLVSMSHEIRTPMNAINGYSELIMKDADDAQKSKYAESIKAASGYLLSIVNSVLDITKIEVGKMDISETEYELSVLLKRITDAVKASITNKGLEFIYEIDENLPEKLYGDCTLIRQIIINIINNAVKTTETGSISLKLTGTVVQGKDTPYINLEWRIRDTGAGIRTADYDNIFNRIEQLNKQEGNYIEGAELGLAVAKAMVDIMDGSLSFTSKVGKGTSFTILLKQRVLDKEQISKKALTLKTEEVLSSNDVRCIEANIMVVDDNIINLEVLNQFLHQYGIKASLIGSGAEAVKAAGEKSYDIIFMDQLMPEMDGIEAMHRIRRLGNGNAEMPIIALTANTLHGTREALLAEGFTDYITKPISMDTLAEVLDRYLPEVKNTVVEKETAAAVQPQEESFLQKENDGEELINVEAAKELCGYDMTTYKKVLKTVYDYLPHELELLEKNWRENDIKSYIIRIHAIKSNAKSIGAMKLADMAYRLELAGKEGREYEIRDYTEEVVEAVQKLLAQIEKMLAE